MKRVAFILVIMFVGIIAFLENSSKQKRAVNFIEDNELEYDDVWWDT